MSRLILTVCSHLMQQPYKKSGVTLIETIMVIALLAAAATTSLLLLDGQWTARRNVTSATNHAADSLAMARNTAIASQSTVRVRRERDQGAARLTITQTPGPFHAGQTWTIDLGTKTRVSGSPTEIEFTPTGTANRTLRWNVAQSRTTGEVTVSPANGQVLRRLP